MRFHWPQQIPGCPLERERVRAISDPSHDQRLVQPLTTGGRPTPPLGRMSFTSGINRSTGSVVIPVDNRSAEMKQPHTEQTLEQTETQQNTGNHKKPGTPDEHGADRFGGQCDR